MNLNRPLLEDILIFEWVSWDNEPVPTLLALACVCREYKEPALDFLRRDLTSIRPIFLMMLAGAQS
jgi:hypothetical protein